MSAGDERPENPREGGRKPSTPFHPDLTWREEITGHKPGDKVVRIARHRYFRGTGPDVLLPRPEATEPHGGFGKLWYMLKHFIIGAPIASAMESQERLSKLKGLAVLSSDALSSVAYATEAAMRVLMVAGAAAALAFTVPISLAVVVLLAVVAISYMQTIRAYPSGGGSYIVARENLGELPGVGAGAALMVGYVLTVAVSIAAGVYALISAFPALERWNMELALGSLALITILNLRGIRESGTVFAAPTYIFVFSIFGMLGYGIFRLATGGITYEPIDQPAPSGTEALTWFLILSAFAKGASAMTGTEAIANSVPAFQKPEPTNARITLGMMAATLGGMFLGISYLVTQIGIVPYADESKTLLADLTRTVVGEGPYFYVVQFATALILLLAANTSYTGFPWLLSVMARDRYAPKWFGGRGDRLVFSVGIMALAIASALLLLVFGSSVDRLLPLYALGVFAAFTLSQGGMVIHWLRSKERGWQRSAGINGIGAVVTGIATVVVGITRFGEGAWMVMVVVPALMLLLLSVNRHYQAVSRQLRTKTIVRPKGTAPLVVVPIPNLNLVSRQALAFAQDLSKRVVAVHVTSDVKDAETIRNQWNEVVGDVPLVIVESPYRMLIPPLLAYVDALRETHSGDNMVVVLPEFVTKHWWENLLHNQTALRLKRELLYRPGITVASFPYHLA